MRYDLLLHKSKDEKVNQAAREYTRELITKHVSGRLKVAPEHTSPEVLKFMRKPSFDLFYEFKNETLDLLSDAELVSFIKQAFDGACAGSIDLLAWQALPALAQHLHEGRSFKSFRLDTEAWV